MQYCFRCAFDIVAGDDLNMTFFINQTSAQYYLRFLAAFVCKSIFNCFFSIYAHIQVHICICS